MKSLKYNELMPRVAIEKLKLMEEQELVNLAGRNLVAIRCALIDSAYKDEILKVPSQETDSNSLEGALLENYAQTLKNLLKFSSGQLKKLLLAIVSKIETSNIKTLLRAKKAKTNPDEAIKNIIPVGIITKKLCQDILSSSNTIEDVVERLFETEYGIIMQKGLTETKTSNSLLPIELALDQATYKKILDIVNKFKGLDKLIAKNVLGIEIDTKNIKIILRGKNNGISKKLIKRYLLPSFFITKQTFSKGLETINVKTLIETLMLSKEVANNPVYQKFFYQILEKQDQPIAQIEDILDKASLRVSLEMQKKYLKYYNVSYVLVLLNLKRIEISNLRCLIIGSKRKMPTAKVKQLLILKK
jgi:vacuolar-type H+-ATPase subunit C/Vma6